VQRRHYGPVLRCGRLALSHGRGWRLAGIRDRLAPELSKEENGATS
jgi:hypothetical protein